MPLCGSNIGCGCALYSVPADVGDIDGVYPTIIVEGAGTPVAPWAISLDPDWAIAVASMGRGVVGFAQVTGDQTGIGTSVTDLTGLSVTWTAEATRRYRTTLYLSRLIQQTGTGVVAAVIADGAGTQLQSGTLGTLTVGASGTKTISYVESGISGSTTRKGQAVTTTNTVNLDIGTNFPAYILVEDIGPV